MIQVVFYAMVVNEALELGVLTTDLAEHLKLRLEGTEAGPHRTGRLTKGRPRTDGRGIFSSSLTPQAKRERSQGDPSREVVAEGMLFLSAPDCYDPLDGPTTHFPNPKVVRSLKRPALEGRCLLPAGYKFTTLDADVTVNKLLLAALRSIGRPQLREAWALLSPLERGDATIKEIKADAANSRKRRGIAGSRPRPKWRRRPLPHRDVGSLDMDWWRLRNLGDLFARRSSLPLVKPSPSPTRDGRSSGDQLSGGQPIRKAGVDEKAYPVLGGDAGGVFKLAKGFLRPPDGGRCTRSFFFYATLEKASSKPGSDMSRIVAKLPKAGQGPNEVVFPYELSDDNDPDHADNTTPIEGDGEEGSNEDPDI
ncbi:hypothetical protein Cgig2_008366 [Carnegiea gigantea]|uniref:Uncharacterized protein n=1 Tax=Carnegiea gigantea TaxID=171969 RepID=A0A9Q1KBS6_9CARY|nr:hypothetical protein Cgig2_008366 [Carnegiea gigantea]